MTCREFVEFLMAYLDAELAPEARAAFTAHIEDCPPCGTYLETYRQTLSLGHAICEDPDGPVPDDVPSRAE